MSVIVYGPQGCGKSANAEVICQHFSVHHLIDGWAPGTELPPDTLALTSVPDVPNALDYFEVMRQVKVARS
jgi:hypothetical protein